MAQPFIVLGLKGANKLIDKHFDKVPDAALHPETYHPANLTSKDHRKRTRQKRAEKNKVGSSSSSDEDSTEEVEEVTADPGGVDIKLEQRGAPRNMFSPPPSATYPPPPPQQEAYVPGAPVYSHEPPRLRPEYAPSPPPIGSGYPYAQGAYAPPPFQPQMIERRGRSDSNDDEDYYSESYHRPRRPKAVTRRSSSYHGPRGGGSGFETIDKARDKAHRYKLKEEVDGMFTKSKEGLAGGAVGALVGGWAARKAQEAKGKEKHPASPLLTLLGAAVGGMAVNAIIEKYEVANGKDGSDKQSGGEGSRDRNAGSDAGRSHRSRRSRRDSRYDDDGYGSGEESDGSKSYRSRRSRRRRESKGNMSDGYD
jgi:hypothetical protein